MAGIADKVDKAYESKTAEELVNAPVAALQGSARATPSTSRLRSASKPSVISAPTSTSAGRKPSSPLRTDDPHPISNRIRSARPGWIACQPTKSRGSS